MALIPNEVFKYKLYGCYSYFCNNFRGNVRSLWMGVLWALTSGTGVALALLQGSAGPLIGIAISASLLPPVVNCVSEIPFPNDTIGR